MNIIISHEYKAINNYNCRTVSETVLKIEIFAIAADISSYKARNKWTD